MKTMENMNLIRKLAWSFHATTGISFDDLVGEATLSYYENLATYEKNKGVKLTTHLYLCIKSDLIDFIRKEKFRTTVDLDNLPFQPSYTMPEFCMEELFSGKAKEVVTMVLEEASTPPSFVQRTSGKKKRVECRSILDFDAPPKTIRGQIVEELRERGWSWNTIWTTLAQIKAIINEN